MLSFFNEPELKIAVRHRVAQHQKLDQIIQGEYWAYGKGCFIGCSLHSSSHVDFQNLLGLPIWLGYLGEAIFEGLPFETAKTFPLRLYDAIPVGIDLENVRRQFFIWLILDKKDGVIRFNDDPRVRAVGQGFEAEIRGESVNWDAAWAAAGDAAWAAAGAAARDAARAAAWAAAGAAAGAAAYKRQAEKLIELIIESGKEQKIKSASELPQSGYFIKYYKTVKYEAINMMCPQHERSEG